MMQGLQEVEPLESLDPVNELTNLLQDWTTNRQSARTLDDILNKLPYTDDKRENLHILEWKTFLIFVNEIIGRKIRIKQVI